MSQATSTSTVKTFLGTSSTFDYGLQLGVGVESADWTREEAAAMTRRICADLRARLTSLGPTVQGFDTAGKKDQFRERALKCLREFADAESKKTGVSWEVDGLFRTYDGNESTAAGQSHLMQIA